MHHVKTLESTRITHFRCKMAKELLAHKAAERKIKNGKIKMKNKWRDVKICMSNYCRINWRENALWIKMKFVKNGVRRKFMAAFRTQTHTHKQKTYRWKCVFVCFFFVFCVHTFGEAFNVCTFSPPVEYIIRSSIWLDR